MLEIQCQAAEKLAENGTQNATPFDGHEMGLAQILSFFQKDLPVELK